MEIMEYTVESIDGDYVYLRNDTQGSDELKCVARALLPLETGIGTRLRYEMFEYSVIG